MLSLTWGMTAGEKVVWSMSRPFPVSDFDTDTSAPWADPFPTVFHMSPRTCWVHAIRGWYLKRGTRSHTINCTPVCCNKNVVSFFSRFIHTYFLLLTTSQSPKYYIFKIDFSTENSASRPCNDWNMRTFLEKSPEPKEHSACRRSKAYTLNHPDITLKVFWYGMVRSVRVFSLWTSPIDPLLPVLESIYKEKKFCFRQTVERLVLTYLVHVHWPTCDQTRFGGRSFFL